jgi:hypothetical protein
VVVGAGIARPLRWSAVEPIQSRFADADVRLTELVSPEHPVLTEFSFTRCHILGPAVVVPEGCSFVACTWDVPGEDISAMLWDVDPSRERLSGVIALYGCTFESCRMSGIGLAGSASQLERFREALG